MTNVTALKQPVTKTATKKQTAPAKGRNAIKALRRQSGASLAIGAVAVTLTGLSLSHLAHGIAIVTGAPNWEGWAMAAGIDLGFVALELAQLAAITDKLKASISRFTKPAIVGTLAGSAAMNAFAFAALTTNPWLTAAAVGMGIAIPGLIYALTRVGAALYIDCNSRA